MRFWLGYVLILAGVVGLGVLALNYAVHPTLGEEKAETCNEYRLTQAFMRQYAKAGAGSIAEAEDDAAELVIDRINAVQGGEASYEGDRVVLFVARQPVRIGPLPLPPGHGLILLFTEGCGTEMLVAAPGALAAMISAPREPPDDSI